MANTRISNLTASAANLAATDVTPVVQTTGVGPVKMTGLQFAGGLLGSTALTGATVTTSQPVLNLTQTWNAGAVTFTGLKFNVTPTAAAALSKLIDLQFSGTTQFSIAAGGANGATPNLYLGTGAPTATNFIMNFDGTNTYLQTGAANGSVHFANSGNWGNLAINTNPSTGNVRIAGSLPFGWVSSSTNSNVLDTILTRAAAATLQLGAADAAAPVAQTLQVQSVVAGTSNTAGTNWTLKGSAGTGTGAGGSIIFQVAPAGSSGTSQNTYATALTINSGKDILTASYIDFGNSAAALAWLYAYGNIDARLNSVGMKLGASTPLVWTQSNGSNDTADVFLRRDAANTLALRNGTTAQTFRVYNTYTSSTNYETFKVDWITTANTCLIGTEKGSGGGTARALALQTDGATRLEITGTGGALFNYAYWHFRSTGSSSASASVISPSNGVMTLGNYNADNFDRLQFGGTSSSFPALKRIASGNCLQVIGADNSASAGFIVGNQALATTATDGFLYIPTCAGTPTGVPTTQTGTAPMVADSTNNKLYFYSGGAWRDAGP